ncbi:uracil phosphoribosyltransferase [Psychroflexus sp. YR1-1]|uniref:Uracil phosphoribosyltransferase n=1 Tax=Psychroflexus aurantiacus TaxID=2709310 RepID=A0A6B3R615_9FLAO|nr:uracil phosphoribosyltransferase [Psychroflexus aurantiacus]NEV92874.1 uracil phosphoribosyltransferase [Psychroflexus aurantiacus]
MKDFFQGIASLFEDVLFIPLDALRALQDDSWWAANALNFVFVLIVFVAFFYWMKQLKKFDESGEENKSVKAHSFLGKNADLD